MGQNERMLLVCSWNQSTNADLLIISLAVWISNWYEKKWGAVCSGAESHADTSCGQSWPSQVEALSTVCEPWTSYGFFSLRCFFLESCSSSPEKVIAGFADLHPPFQVHKVGVHLQSLSIISLRIKLKCQSMQKACWLVFRAVHCPDSLPGNPW